MTRGVVCDSESKKASAAMKTKHREMDFAIEVFVRGHSAGKSRTFPYEARRVGLARR